MCINEKRAVKSGGIETVVKVLNTHINNNSVCKWGSRALCNIVFDSKQNEVYALRNRSNTSCISDENGAKARKIGAIEIIVNVMNAHIKNFDTCISGCKAIAKMVEGNRKTLNYNHKTIKSGQLRTK